MMLLQTPTTKPAGVAQAVQLSIVVPCFNEEESLDQLAERLKTIHAAFRDQFNIEVVLVDDGSTDQTATGLENRFHPTGWAKVIRHPQNRGITAAILTGITSASNELVASIDADCTYDPIQISSLFEHMREDVAMVTASPYHPQGSVEGIPAWRLGLSRAASRCYGLLLGTKLHTYTSCFRIYRRSQVLSLPVKESGFVGVAELLWLLQRQGGKIVEAPARLTSRRIGFSKMKTLPVIAAHLRLMARILIDRLKGQKATAP